jgi:hypothetical protein
VTPQETSAILRRGFTAEQLEWKIQTCGKSKAGKLYAQIVPYVDARAITTRLDEAFGPLGYSITYRPTNELSKPAMICRIEANGVVREDVCEETDIEPAKGAASGAKKRAAVQFNIGSYLYAAPVVWAVVSEDLKAFHNRGKTKDGTVFSWDLPQEAITWIYSTLMDSTGGTVSAPVPTSTSTTASPPPSKPESGTALPKSSSTSDAKIVMPGKAGFWDDHAGKPIEDVPDSVLEQASDHYATKTTGKWGKLAVADLAIISAELSRRYGPPKTVSVPAQSAPAHEEEPPLPEEPGDLDSPDDDGMPNW